MPKWGIGMSTRAPVDITPDQVTMFPHRCLVRAYSREKITEGGIIIPDTAKEDVPAWGQVIAVGPDCYFETDEGGVYLEIGWNVFYGKYNGVAFQFDCDPQGEYRILKVPEDIYCRLGDTPTKRSKRDK
jgi:co-chaperonin GroES (HSP10)